MSKKYYLFIGEKKVPVTKKVARAYWRYEAKEKYQVKRDKKYRIYPFSIYTYRGQRLNDVADPFDLEDIVLYKLELEALYVALEELTPEEKEIIKRIFFEEQTTREVALNMNMSQSWVIKRKKSILKKLKSILETK